MSTRKISSASRPTYCGSATRKRSDQTRRTDFEYRNEAFPVGGGDRKPLPMSTSKNAANICIEENETDFGGSRQIIAGGERGLKKPIKPAIIIHLQQPEILPVQPPLPARLFRLILLHRALRQWFRNATEPEYDGQWQYRIFVIRCPLQEVPAGFLPQCPTCPHYGYHCSWRFLYLLYSCRKGKKVRSSI